MRQINYNNYVYNLSLNAEDKFVCYYQTDVPDTACYTKIMKNKHGEEFNKKDS